MPIFRFTARLDGTLIQGQLEAGDADEVARALTERGAVLEQLEAMEAERPTDRDEGTRFQRSSLGQDELLEVGRQVAGIAKAGLPLGSGLRALAAEIPSWQTARALRHAALLLEKGYSLDEIGERAGASLPAHVRAVIRASLRAREPGLVLEQYFQCLQFWSAHRRRLLLTMIYPLTLLVITLAVFGVFLIWIIPIFEVLFDGFDLNLPEITTLFIALSKIVRTAGPFLLVLAAGMSLAACFLWEKFEPLAQRVLYAVPGLGSALRSASVAESCQLLALMLEAGEPMPTALKLVAGMTRDRQLSREWIELAACAERGELLQTRISNSRVFPSELSTFFRWEGNQTALVESVRSAASLFETRYELQLGVFASCLAPISIQVSACCVGSLFLALFLPLLRLLNDLS